METSKETEIINKEMDVIIVTTKTVELLLSKKPDSLSLYMFYLKNAKIQKTNCIFNTENFGMKGLGWGRDRYRSAKKILVKEGFIEDVPRRDSKGKILGHYLQINYIFTKNTTNEILASIDHGVETPTSGEEETNALSNKTINALTNTTKIPVSTANEGKNNNKEVPYSFIVELNKLRDSTRHDYKVIALYWANKKFMFQNKEQFDSNLARELRPAKLLKGYSGNQIAQSINYCKNNYDVWSLETVGKRISDLVNKK